MSFQAQNWANKQKTGNISGRAILMTLANYADENGCCYPSQARLAQDCECSERTIRQWLDKLEESGLIMRVRRNRGNGSRTSDLITLNLSNSLTANSAVSEDSLAAEYSKPTGKCRRPIISQVNLSEDIMSETSSDAPPKPKKQKQSYPEQFENCWKKYPTDQNMSKKEAYDEWKKLSDEDKASLDASIPAFKAFCEKDTTYRPIHMCRYISKRRYDGFKPQEQSQAQITNIDDARWQKFLAYARDRQEWPIDLWGAMPNHDGCIVPKHLIQPDDGKNWREIKSVKAA